MTTDLAIDEALALAIGWRREQMREHLGALWLPGRGDVMQPPCDVPPLWPWLRFSHKDPAVIWPIAERFNAFPARMERGWICVAWINGKWHETTHPHPATAVALAVIEAMK